MAIGCFPNAVPMQALFLPEASDYIASSAKESIFLVRSVEESEFVRGIQAEARSANLAINVGVHEPALGGRVKNTLLWISEDGEIVQRYQKLHLFDVSVKDGPQIRESEYGSRSHPWSMPANMKC